jgi:hypothetical protein
MKAKTEQFECVPLLETTSIDFLILYFIAAILSLAQWWIFLQYHESDFHEIGLATANFFHGETHWRAFQNRLLGPGLVVLVQRVLHYWRHIDEYDRALRAYYWAVSSLKCNGIEGTVPVCHEVEVG